MTTLVTLGEMSLTGVDAFGCDWRTVSPIDGWDGSPSTTFALTQKPRQPGGWLGPRPQLTPRSIVLQGLVQAPDADALEAALDRLNEAAVMTAPGAVLSIQRGSVARTSTVYRDGDVEPVEVTGTLYQWTVNLTAPDPRKYGPTLTASTGLPHSSGGLTWPVTWPIEWSGVSDSGTLSIDNPGNADAPLVLRIDGPVTAPKIRHVASGAELVLASNYALPAGSFLTVDMEARTVLEGGTASRNGWITSRGWFQLDKGANDLIFSADTYNATARLTATFAPAYL